MADDPKFVIGDTEYLVPTKFRLTDPVLIEDVTGLDFQEFSERLDAVNNDDEVGDYKVTLGLVACAVWQKHERWSRAKVLRFLENVDVTSLDVQAPEAPAADPPTVAPAATRSSGRSKTPGSGTSDESTTTPEDSAAEVLV